MMLHLALLHSFSLPSNMPLCFYASSLSISGFPDGSVVKNPPANAGAAETWVLSLGGEDPLEEEMATHSNILAWKIPWTEEPGGATVHGFTNSQT